MIARRAFGTPFFARQLKFAVFDMLNIQGNFLKEGGCSGITPTPTKKTAGRANGDCALPAVFFKFNIKRKKVIIMSSKKESEPEDEPYDYDWWDDGEVISLGNAEALKLDRVGQICVYRCGDLAGIRELAREERCRGNTVLAKDAEQTIAKLEGLDGMVCVVKEELDTEEKIEMELRMDTCEIMFSDGSILLANSDTLEPLKKMGAK
jgi:hypothetical protein